MEREDTVVYVELENKKDNTTKKVYVTLVSGMKSLDLYSGWDPQHNCHKNPLNALPKEVCTFSFLQRLWASHNHFTSLPPEIGELTNLTELFLHHNHLDMIPTRLCTLKNLRLLWLNNNKIASVPYEIVQLKSLKRLHLDNNLISVFPDHLCQLTDLEILYLNNNKIQTISSKIDEMTSLVRLYLHSNQIVEIPDELGLLLQNSIKLQLLRLDNNRISKIPENFSQYRKDAENRRLVLRFEGNPFEIRRISPVPQSLTNKDQVPRRHSYAGKDPREIQKTHRPSVPTKIDMFAPEKRSSIPSRPSVPANMDKFDPEKRSGSPFK